MASDKAAKRRKLFDLYAANLAIHYPQHRGKFACPICLTLFSEDALAERPPAVSLAHVFPESCGGNRETLTCTKCNSEMGTRYDRQLADEKKFFDGKNGAGIHARFRTKSGSSVGGKMTFLDGRIHFEEVPKWTHPEQRDQTIRDFESGTTVEFQAKGYDHQRIDVALLHSAYLAMFHQFGYEYVRVDEPTSWLRELFSQPKPPEKVPIYIVNLNAGIGEGVSHFRNSVGIARTPAGDFFFAVVLPHNDPTYADRIILLPGFSTDAKDRYEMIGEQPDFRVEYFVDMRVTEASLDSALRSPVEKWRLMKLWQTHASSET